MISYYTEHPAKGECVLIIQGRTLEELKKESQEQFQELDLMEHMERYLGKGLSQKEAMKLVAKDRGVGKRDIYQELLRYKK